MNVRYVNDINIYLTRFEPDGKFFIFKTCSYEHLILMSNDSGLRKKKTAQSDRISMRLDG